MPYETWNAGADYDQAVAKRLGSVLEALGYKSREKWWGVGGSQELTRLQRSLITARHRVGAGVLSGYLRANGTRRDSDIRLADDEHFRGLESELFGE